MDEVLGQRHCTNPPVLIASIPEDTPGPSSAVGAHGEEEPGAAAAPAAPAAPARRQRDKGQLESEAEAKI